MFLHFLIIAFLAISGSNGADECLTSTRSQGKCINPNQCSAPHDVKTSDCGFDGAVAKVCCPDATQVTVPIESSKPYSPAEGPPPNVANHPKLRLLDDDLCGTIIEPKGLKDHKTTVMEFPWMALIAYSRANQNTSYNCGGSIVSKRYVLTAAVCVTGLPSTFTVTGVRVGEHNLGTERDCDVENGAEVLCAEKYQDLSIESIHPHSDYNKVRSQNDIALIRLNGDIDFGPRNVRPICLPIGSAAGLDFEKFTASGWGRTDTGFKSDVLLQWKLPLVANNECASIYKKHDIEVWYKQLCAGGVKGEGTCSGDAGGPLQSPAVYANGQTRYIQFGVISTGPTACRSEGIAEVFTRVAYYMDWILDTMTD